MKWRPKWRCPDCDLAFEHPGRDDDGGLVCPGCGSKKIARI